eukprot:GHVQ01029706.1.p1 GENE.GHVQ01029706.1~~GHVQ01029706.1.p1  ORF type:complete len:462 (+),score=127.29 GHVQ01029706.1:777-2162(+)
MDATRTALHNNDNNNNNNNNINNNNNNNINNNNNNNINNNNNNNNLQIAANDQNQKEEAEQHRIEQQERGGGEDVGRGEDLGGGIKMSVSADLITDLQSIVINTGRVECGERRHGIDGDDVIGGEGCGEERRSESIERRRNVRGIICDVTDDMTVVRKVCAISSHTGSLRDQICAIKDACVHLTTCSNSNSSNSSSSSTSRNSSSSNSSSNSSSSSSTSSSCSSSGVLCASSVCRPAVFVILRVDRHSNTSWWCVCLCILCDGGQLPLSVRCTYAHAGSLLLSELRAAPEVLPQLIILPSLDYISYECWISMQDTPCNRMPSVRNVYGGGREEEALPVVCLETDGSFESSIQAYKSRTSNCLTLKLTDNGCACSISAEVFTAATNPVALSSRLDQVECRLYLMRIHHATWLFVSCPDGSPARQKLLYAAAMNSVVAVIQQRSQPVTRTVDIRQPSDLIDLH